MNTPYQVERLWYREWKPVLMSHHVLIGDGTKAPPIYHIAPPKFETRQEAEHFIRRCKQLDTDAIRYEYRVAFISHKQGDFGDVQE